MFVTGLASGATLALTFISSGGKISKEGVTADASDARLPVVDELSEEADSSHDMPSNTSQDSDRNSGFASGTRLDPANLPNTPPVYVELLGPSYRNVSLEDLHFTFSHETREEGWAFSVESEITHYIANNGVSEWAVIEHVECRKYTCEIAGYLLGVTDHDPREILEGISDSTWWHDQRSAHQVSGRRYGLERFMIIITGKQFSDRRRPPRLVD